MTDHATADTPRLYDGEGDHLLEADKRSDRVIMLPAGDARQASTDRDRIRILWGQHLLADLLAGRYRSVICGVNADDNSHGIVADLLNLVSTSQWTAHSATAYAKVFQDSTALHAATDREPYILKFDLDRLLILAILRPAGRDHFTIEDIRKGFATANKMLSDRQERWPSASVSFLGAKSNRLIDEDGQEPTFESVLRAMYDSGYRGDVYPPLSAWQCAPTGVFATYPYPASLSVMRSGGF